ncbi:hypothetical protein EX30DRAFT_173294 [Ascodesmis nigricans]|uniref:Uncharacterized protein n=1 Tax=Ascodesmis nigricans TaxID=341454 RepID=A0A4S2MLM6_9PEZI|nr:hypothetical protein EX30DRAFT_173294 [Ascodesmis nigricans]
MISLLLTYPINVNPPFPNHIQHHPRHNLSIPWKTTTRSFALRSIPQPDTTTGGSDTLATAMHQTLPDPKRTCP